MSAHSPTTVMASPPLSTTEKTSAANISTTTTTTGMGMSVGYARFFGSASAGLLELAIFHPVDTIAKRLMTSTDKYIHSNVRDTASSLNQTIFRDKVNASVPKKLVSLFPGLGWATCYKVSQRIYKYGGQPVVADYMQLHYGNTFTQTFGERRGKQLIAATAGSLIGMGEVLLLPFDVMKIKAQTKGPTAATTAGSSTPRTPSPQFATNAQTISAEGHGAGAAIPRSSALGTIRMLYAGAGWTILRNAPGSFTLFGANAFMYSSVLGVADPKKATFLQMFLASTVSAAASIIVAAPIDTVKTRVQKQPFGVKHQNGREIIANLIRNEGITALFKGLAPKLAVVGPKLVFSFTMAQYFTAHLQR